MTPLAHDVRGDGSAVLLLHAGVADRRMWEPQLDVLASAHRVVRVDLRGYGESPLPDQPYDHVADVVEVLDALGVEHAAVVGASFGGYVALELARRHPHRVDRLVLLCPASGLLEPDEELRAFWRREAELADAGDLAAAVALNVETWCGPEADDAARDLVATMQGHAFELQEEREDLEVDEEPGDPATITAPTLVVSGDHDLAAFRSSAAALADALPHGRLVRFEWAGHLPSLERPAELTDLLRAELSGGS